MGQGRYQTNNLITSASMLTVSSATDGIVGSAVPYPVSGSAVFVAQGPYTGDDDHLYIVQIDNINAGDEVGQATFCWRRDDSVGWEATGVATDSVFLSLGDGVQIKWTSGSGSDFVVGDTWSFLAVRIHGRGALVDRKATTALHTTSVTGQYIIIDLGDSQQVTSFILGMHNLTSGASIALSANDTDSWGSPSYSAEVAWSSRNAGLYLDQTYRYWRVDFSDPGNADGFLRVGDLYLGTYVALSQNFVDSGYGWTPTVYGEDLIFGSNPSGRYAMGRGLVMDLAYELLPTADLEVLQAIWEEAHDDLVARASVPIWLTPNSDAPGRTIFGLFGSTLPYRNANPQCTYWSVSFSFVELPRG